MDIMYDVQFLPGQCYTFVTSFIMTRLCIMITLIFNLCHRKRKITREIPLAPTMFLWLALVVEFLFLVESESLVLLVIYMICRQVNV